MKARYLGHSAVLLVGTKTVLFDPFLTGNPKAACTADSIRACDFIVVTHDHEDHLGDAFSIARRTGATIVAIHELAVRAASEGLSAEGMNIGGSIRVGDLRFSMTHSTHSATTGHPAGFILEMDGKTIYHMGDTGLTADLKILPEFFRIDLAFVPIGDRYTMGPVSAATAVRWCEAKRAVPVHYNTWPPIEVDPADFARRLPPGVVVVLAPGASAEM